ncbi:hypothetical protein MGG_03896 [Pyricularia oryzae 70-15]|uniref:AB hydrolase-1 domain-containing protein n=1 Tax=Pyricularia oryzae (strain 70-15 / ATCC MYA-4617 / FGSC 8958) TaxID=242507 RepID=G4NHA3_PYRO7|nr:uncharacterized protein MGG_03896 [Pyricularia oryzae 70-15]EHA47613.1 hypothetical protein MGG_03896 [Pyricularia oryzae 70-15]KAI7924582.1 hypothetical protein M9X92_003782 [Pyricularia oryzae]KAI7931914.1 hypothetical protein M0657_000928 [Pyricularia oryzae]
MVGLHLSYRWLRWTKPSEKPESLPDGVERHFVKTPLGDIEVLYSGPSEEATPTTSTPRQPLFFVHGGMGSAWVWLEYMRFLSSHGIPCYAVSMRGHGNSWHPSYIRMVFFTPRSALAQDVVAAIRWTQQREQGAEVVLVGHSSGGGMLQGILSEGLVSASGLVLAGAVPGFGSMGVYMNWWRADPWFALRMMLHGWHSNSPLSHPALVKNIFFSNEVSDSYVVNFFKHSNSYESYFWPFSMMRPFVKANSLLKQLGGISGWDRQRILILGGGGDKIMTVPIMQKLASYYRHGVLQLVGEDKLALEAVEDVEPLAGEGGLDDAGQGVQFCIVPKVGHHMQNDVHWEIGARKLLEFYRQLS